MVAKDSKLGFVVTGLLLGILMASMDNTIVVTAMGTIVGDLGGLENFVWVVSAYMVAEMAGMPIFGKLSDMYGRKKFFIFGLIVFMIGSALCGTAENITQLGIYRAIQGIGGERLFRLHLRLYLISFRPKNAGKWADCLVRCLDCLVFSVRYLVHILRTILAGTGCFILTCR